MRRATFPAHLLLPLVLLTACSSGGGDEGGDARASAGSSASASAGSSAGASAGPSAGASAGPSASASAGPSASASVAPAAVEGEEVLPTDPSHLHREGPLTYEAVPPLGGEHNPRWLACDVYDEPVPNEFAVHSLEHGAVWLTHAPDLPAGQVAALAELAGLNREYVLVSPQGGLATPVVAAAWGRKLEVQQAQDPRLREFVEAWAGGAQGGEPGVPCRTSGLSPRQAVAQLGGTSS